MNTTSKSTYLSSLSVFTGPPHIAHITSSNAYAQNVAALDAKYGFSDAKFGMAANTLKGLYFYQSTGDYRVIYSRKKPYLLVGDIRISRADYTFVFGKLSSIFFYVDTKNYEALIKTLKIAYGKPNIRNEEFYGEWAGKRVRMSYGIGRSSTGQMGATVELSTINHEAMWQQAESMDQAATVKKRLKGL